MKRREHWPSYARRLRKKAEEQISAGKYPENEIEKSMEIPDSYSRAFALAEIYLRLCKAGMDGGGVWQKAISAAQKISPEWKREEILERMVSIGVRCNIDVSSFPDMLNERELRMKLLSKIIRLSDENEMETLWKLWENREEKDRYELLRMMVHNGLPIERAVEMASELSEERVEMIKRYAEGRKEAKKREKESIEVHPLNDGKAKFTMALYNTYKGKAGEVHYRSISRASALCYAFDLNLMLVNFPFRSAEECVERTVSNTRIGDGSEYLRELHRAGRFEIHESVDEIEGIIVATTPHPDPEKALDISEIRDGMVFLLGLGHDGLPKRILEGAQYHMEFTGKGASLETCTAMGVLACLLGSKLK